MWQHTKLTLKALILLAGLWQAMAAQYNFVTKTGHAFQRCPKVTEEEPSLFGLGDLAKSHFSPDSQALALAGKATLTWIIKTTTRIQANLDIYHLEDGEWILSQFSKTFFNFCESHLIQATCKNGPEHNLQLVPHNLNITLNTNEAQSNSPHKIVFTFKAFDLLQIEPTTKICFEILGRFRQLELH